MVFKSFQSQVALRLVLIALTCYAVAYVVQLSGYWVTLGNLGLFLLLQLIFFFRFLTRWQRDIRAFANSVKHGDYTITYHLLKKDDPHYELHQMLNNVTRHVREVKSQFEQQSQYFQYVVENAQIGLIAYEENGKVILCNNEALKLTGQAILKNIHDLRQTDQNLYSHLIGLGLSQSRLILGKKQNPVKLSARLAKFVVDGRVVFLLSLVNIRPELEENELQSWQELISVLTHEIMNSISPIHSLSGSMHKYLDRVEGNEETVSKAKNSLEVISRRSQSLMGFVDRYRTVSTVPLPHLQPVKADTLIHSVLTLLQDDLIGVEIKVNHNSEIIEADFQQLEQVLINLLKNAVHAMKNSPKKRITISVTHAEHRIQIVIADSGKGISADVIDKIFIPFFTTRPEGSGIGLTLSRQIMHRHGGYIEVHSEEGNGSSFVLVLPGKRVLKTSSLKVYIHYRVNLCRTNQPGYASSLEKPYLWPGFSLCG
jgi:two-component system nitrogen regulation sensor histidine kinase NtrY